MKTHERLDRIVGLLLAAGTLTSVTLIAVGIVWHGLATGTPRFDYTLAGTTVFQFVLDDVRQLAAGALRPRLLVNVGMAVLLLTPYTRVLASMAYFALVERNSKYTVFTGIVLATLTYSLFLR